LNSHESLNVDTLSALAWADSRLAWSDVFYSRKWSTDVVFSDCGICTYFHCKIYFCLIYTSIRFVTLSTVPTSRVTFTETFTGLSRSLDTLSLCTKDNCRKNTKLQSTCARAATHFKIKYNSVNSL
jgi:hypothetical protein